MAQSINETATANGNYPSNNGIDWPGGGGEFRVLNGTWDGATAKVQMSDDGTNWVDEPSGLLSFTADERYGFTATPCKIRINVANVGTTSIQLVLGRTDRAGQQ